MEEAKQVPRRRGRVQSEREVQSARKRLNDYIKLRGDVVHRSRRVQPGPPEVHPVKKDELEKAIRFLKNRLCPRLS